ncbi:MAG: 30S ribosomal protein S16 [Planctomycetes bacterium]|nr:30S ribosomal protein S16 [Planctomycetota bacterium]
MVRLKRFGRKHRPFFRIEVMEKRSARDGRSLEQIGYYDPLVASGDGRLKFNGDRVLHWYRLGAQPSEAVRTLLAGAGFRWPARAPKKVKVRKTARRRPTTLSERGRAKLERRRAERARGERRAKAAAATASAAKAAAAAGAGAGAGAAAEGQAQA